MEAAEEEGEFEERLARVRRLAAAMDMSITDVSTLLKQYGENDEKLMNAYFEDPERTLLDAGLGARLARDDPPAPTPAPSVMPVPAPPAPKTVARNAELEAQVVQGSALMETMLTAELLRKVVGLLRDELVYVALASKTLRNASFTITANKRRHRVNTPIRTCFASESRLLWALERGGVPKVDLCAEAMRAGTLAMLQHVHARGAPWGILFTREAATRGQEALLIWAVQNGCPWSPNTLKACIEAGHIGLLHVARTHGCPWTWGDAGAAGKCGEVGILHLAYATGCPGIQSSDTFDGTCAHDNTATLEWLRASGCEWRRNESQDPGPPASFNLMAAATHGCINVMQWLRDAGCAWPQLVSERTAQEGQLEALQWLHAHGAYTPVAQCLAAAKAGKHAAVVQWIEAAL